MTAHACPICESGAASAVFLRYDSLEWHRCAGCGGGWLSPYTSELARDDEDFAAPYKAYAAARAVFDAVADEKAGWVLRHLTPGMAFVELGPGIGSVAAAIRRRSPATRILLVEPRDYFAKVLRESGFEVYGAEPDQATDSALAAVRQQGKRALILMDNVLEHVTWPGRLLARLHRGSPPGSRLLVEVPNEAGLAWRARVQDFLRGEKKPPTFPGHINLFTRASLAQFGERVCGQPVVTRYNPIRSTAQVAYLSQQADFNWRIRAAVAALNLLPVDRLLGVAYWLRAEIGIGGLRNG
ncbi:MAG: class I SAM-dependent methyltransferase [Gammaproteobacteria bacterium]|nr:class I SAM-dependent methyltransferase [Gammaproteobacteria bacterium]